MLQAVLLDWYQERRTELAFEPDRIWIAYSGGRDSHALLHAFRATLPLAHLVVCHVNHALYPESVTWMQHCQSVASSLDLPFLSHTLTSRPVQGESLEAWAREARYSWFRCLLGPKDLLCTAHTQNDQAETLFLNLLRGSGVKGLSGIAPIQSFGGGFLARPFLTVPREGINEYCSAFNLNYLEDTSNTDLSFSRNYLRHKIFPQLSKRYPGVFATMSRSAQHCAEATVLMNELAEIDFQQINLFDGNRLAVKGLRQLSRPRQKNVLRYWFSLQGLVLPSEVKLNDILNQVLQARNDRHPEITWGKTKLRRVKGEILFLEH